jgi:hypothetical protein
MALHLHHVLDHAAIIDGDGRRRVRIQRAESLHAQRGGFKRIWFDVLPRPPLWGAACPSLRGPCQNAIIGAIGAIQCPGRPLIRDRLAVDGEERQRYGVAGARGCASADML